MRRNTLTAELLAEFLGTFTLSIFGLGVVAHFVLRNAVGDPLPAPGTFGNFTTVNFAWGFGVVMGVYVAGGVSGAHINPAVTTSLALRRGFPWAKVGPYIIAQVLGAFVAALLIRWNFYEWFNQVDPGKTFATQGIFSTSPGPGMSVLGGLRSEIIGTAAPGDADPGHHRRAQHRPGGQPGPVHHRPGGGRDRHEPRRPVRVRDQPGP